MLNSMSKFFFLVTFHIEKEERFSVLQNDNIRIHKIYVDSGSSYVRVCLLQ